MKTELQLDEERVAAYELLMKAQSHLATRLTREGATDAQIERALEVSEPAHPELLAPEELYLGTMARFVNALGGSLELSAAFGPKTEDPPAQ